MADENQVKSWLEGLAEDDWRMYHSDSEVQNIAKAALELLQKQPDNCKHCAINSMTGLRVCQITGTLITDGYFCEEWKRAES